MPVSCGLEVVVREVVGNTGRILHTTEFADLKSSSMPCVVFELHTYKLLYLSITHSQDEVAGSVGVSHAFECVLQRCIKLKDVSQDVLQIYSSKGTYR